MTSSALDWIKQFSPALLQLDETPLYGAGPEFPWGAFAAELSKELQLENLKIEPGNRQWRSADQLLEGLGASPQVFHILFSGLEGSLHWIISKDAILAFMEKLLVTKSETFEKINPEFLQGFTSFLAAQAINCFQKIEFDKNISPSLSEDNKIPEAESFCIDVSISLPEKNLIGRALLSPSLLQSWKERYADRKLTPNLTSPLAQKLQLHVALEAGSTSLSHEELKALTPGDFVLLDKCSFEPEGDKGRLMMTIDGVPLFRARLKQGSLKILEFPLYHELEAPMSNKESDEDEHFEDLEDEESEIEESEVEESEVEESEIEDLDEESSSEESEIEVEEEPEEKAPLPTKQKLSVAKPAPKKNGPIVPTELPVNITVEVGRLQMSIQKIMELQPGNVLELDIHPENGVDLVVNGRRIAKGELLKAGETLGIRILDIG